MKTNLIAERNNLNKKIQKCMYCARTRFFFSFDSNTKRHKNYPLTLQKELSYPFCGNVNMKLNRFV